MKVKNMTVNLPLTSCVMLPKGFNVCECQFLLCETGITIEPTSTVMFGKCS